MWMVCSRTGAHTGNRNRRSAAAGRAKEVEQGRQEARDEPPASSHGRWQTGSDATTSKRPNKGRGISGG